MSNRSFSVRRAAGVGLLALATATGGLAVLAAPAQAAGTNRYVTTGGSDVLGQGANDCTVQATPCRHITHAIVEASAGDTIVIGAGTFDENLSVTKSLTFAGAGSSGSGKTVVDGSAADTPTFRVDGSDGAIQVTFQNIAVDGNADSVGIIAENNVTLTVTGSSVSGNGFTGEGTDAAGIYAQGGVTLNVADSTVSNNGGPGIFAPFSVTTHLTNSTADNNGTFGLDIGDFATATTIDASEIKANKQDGVFVFANTNLAKRRVVVVPSTLHITGSTVSDNGEHGVDARNTNVATTVSGSTIDGNGRAGVYFNGTLLIAKAKAAAASDAPLHITDSTISNNAEDGVYSTADTTISGSTLNGNGQGGADLNGVGTIETSTFDSNTGAGLWLEPNATTTVTASTVSNTKPFTGDTSNGGAGAVVFGSTLHVEHSTLAGNTGRGILDEAGTVTVNNSTVTGTKAAVDKDPSGGLVLQEVRELRRAAAAHRGAKARVAAAASPSLTVTGSIVAAQKTGVPDCFGAIVDGGYNLSSDAANSCGFSAAKHDLIKTDPLLGALGDNGGPTKTEAPLKHSPAIDVVPSGSAGCTSGATDQRGIARPQPSGGACDIGAVELAAKALAIHPDALPHGTVGKAYSQQITATGGQFPSYTFAFESGDLPPGLTFGTDGKISGTPTKQGTFTFTVSVNDPVLKTYTIVIDAASTAPISNTGAHVGGLAVVGGEAILLGLLLLLGARYVGRRAQHRLR